MALKDAPGFTEDTGMLLESYLGSSPHHSVVFQSFLSLPKRFDLDATYRYVSGVPAEAVSAYQTGDVRLGWRLAEGLEFSVVGQNLLQPYHTEFGGDPGPLVEIKRSVYGKVTWRR
jgi:iron complex outermembrane receptor protein